MKDKQTSDKKDLKKKKKKKQKNSDNINNNGITYNNDQTDNENNFEEISVEISDNPPAPFSVIDNILVEKKVEKVDGVATIVLNDKHHLHDRKEEGFTETLKINQDINVNANVGLNIN